MSRTTECRDDSFFESFFQLGDFAAARISCLTRGGDLAVIPDARTNEDILALNLGTNDFVWIGLSTPDFRTSTNPSVFRFVDGTRLSNDFGLVRGESPWLLNQPSNVVPGQQSGCVGIFRSQLWAAIPCDLASANFVCEFPCVVTKEPTESPSKTPTQNPTREPTMNPTRNPTQKPTLSPTFAPTFSPTISPTIAPTKFPTDTPSSSPIETVVVEESSSREDPTMAIVVSISAFIVLGIIIIGVVLGLKTWKNNKRKREHERSLLERQVGMNEVFKNTKKLVEENI